MFFRFRLPLFLLLALPVTVLSAQSGSAENDAQVQQLYQDAKMAQSRGDLEGAIAGYESILKLAPRLGPAYNNLGTLYFRKQDYPKAAAILEKGLQIDPGMQSAVALLGISLYEMGEYSAARPRLETALKANPADENVRLYLAKDLTRLGDLENAERQLRDLSAKQPDNQEIWYLLAKLHMKLSERDLARMKQINPDSVWSHQLSGEVMESMNNYEGAIVELKKAVEMAPYQTGTHYKLGDAYWALSQWDHALEQFQAELAVDPGSCLAHWKLASVLLQKNADPQEALSNLNDALKRCPALDEARADRGRALLQLNRTDEAVADLEKAAKASPDNASIHFLLGKTYRTLGRTRESQAEMKMFTTLDEKARAAVAEQAQEVIKNKETAH